jgi:chromosome segregation ATPase
MATAATNRNLCDACGKARGISKCEGCSKIFCYNHFGEHRQELNNQLDEVEVTCDLFRQTLTEQTTEPQKHTLVQQIDDWERDSIKRIRQTAKEAREMVLKHTTKHMSEIEVQLNKLTNQLRQSREENDFVETDLHQWKKQLTQLTKELATPSTIKLQQDSKPLVTKIYVDVSAGKYTSH